MYRFTLDLYDDNKSYFDISLYFLYYSFNENEVGIINNDRINENSIFYICDNDGTLKYVDDTKECTYEYNVTYEDFIHKSLLLDIDYLNVEYSSHTRNLNLGYDNNGIVVNYDFDPSHIIKFKFPFFGIDINLTNFSLDYTYHNRESNYLSSLEINFNMSGTYDGLKIRSELYMQLVNFK